MPMPMATSRNPRTTGLGLVGTLLVFSATLLSLSLSSSSSSSSSLSSSALAPARQNLHLAGVGGGGGGGGRGGHGIRGEKNIALLSRTRTAVTVTASASQAMRRTEGLALEESRGGKRHFHHTRGPWSWRRRRRWWWRGERRSITRDMAASASSSSSSSSPSPLRVLVVGDGLGGPGAPSVNLANYLSARLLADGHATTLLLPRKPGEEKEREKKGKGAGEGGAKKVGEPATLHKLPRELSEDHRERLASLSRINYDEKHAEEEEKAHGPAEALLAEDLDGFDAVLDLSSRAEHTEALLKAFAGKKPLKRWVYVSSPLVYGHSHYTTLNEESELRPFTNSTLEKVRGEELVKQSGFPFTVIRPGFIVAPNNEDSLENYFFARHDQGERIVIPGHGQFLVGLVHAEDLAEGIVHAMSSPAADGGTFNMQIEQGISFDGLALETAKVAEAEPPSFPLIHYSERHFEWVFTKRPQFPIPSAGHLCASSEKARKALGWQPTHNITEALKDSFEHDFDFKKFKQELPEVDLSLDEIVKASPHKQLQIDWGFPFITATRPIGAPNDVFRGDFGNRWEWE